MTPEKLLLGNLIARVGLAAGIAIYEAIMSAPTDAEAIKVLKARIVKTADDYIAEDLASRK